MTAFKVEVAGGGSVSLLADDAYTDTDGSLWFRRKGESDDEMVVAGFAPGQWFYFAPAEPKAD